MLIQTYLTQFSTRHKKGDLRLSEEAQTLLMNYSWPGNVREVRNVIESAVVLSRSNQISASDLPLELRSNLSSTPNSRNLTKVSEDILALTYKEAKRQFEIGYITSRLQQNGGNVSKTAADIGLHRQSLQQKLRELGIER